MINTGNSPTEINAAYKFITVFRSPPNKLSTQQSDLYPLFVLWESWKFSIYLHVELCRLLGFMSPL